MRKVYKKQSANLRQYKKVRESYLEDNPNCEAKTASCSYHATEIHHVRGRCGQLLTDVNNFLAVCRNCHNWIENNVLKAKELGFSKSRLEI